MLVKSIRAVAGLVGTGIGACAESGTVRLLAGGGGGRASNSSSLSSSNKSWNEFCRTGPGVVCSIRCATRSVLVSRPVCVLLSFFFLLYYWLYCYCYWYYYPPP